MITIDEATSTAPPDICFRTAADVERWPDILPHYRWVRFHRKQGFAEGIVEKVHALNAALDLPWHLKLDTTHPVDTLVAQVAELLPSATL